MQRRTSVLLLLQRAVVHAPKRPMDGGVAAAAVATPAAANAATRPPLPRQTPTPGGTTQAAASAPPAGAAARPSTLVTPPAATAAPAVSGGGAVLRKKKIIRRIVKKKKAAAAAGSGTAEVAPAPSVEQQARPTSAEVPPQIVSPEATPARRAHAMLHKIRKQPEGAMQEATPAAAEEEEHEAVTTAQSEEEPQQQPPAQVAQQDEEAYAPTAAATAEHHAEGGGEVEAAAPEEEDLATATTKSTTVAPADPAAHYAEDMKALHDVTDEGAAATQSTHKTAMVKGYRIEEVSNLCSPSDAMFARRLTSGGCQFFAWPGTPLPVASAAILSMPDTIRTVHAVFGRPGTPMDIVMDIDCQVPQEYWTMTKIRPFQMKLLDDVLGVLKEEIEKIGESIETQVVLQSPNLKKASFHVHTKLKDAAFADFHSVNGFLSKFQDRMPNVDMQIYRSHGMLRMFSCMKENHTSAIVVFDDPKWNIGFPGGKFQSGAFSGTYGEVDAEGQRLMPQVLLPLTEKEAVMNASRWLRQATEVEVGEWRSWIGLGLCAYRLAYHFRNVKGLPRPALEELLDAWAEASRKCPQKYHSGECQNRWATFSPEKLGDRSDWWGAYKRLGRMEVAAMEAAQRKAQEEEAIKAARASRAARRAAATGSASSAVATPAEAEPVAALATPAAAAAAAPPVAAASRKLKLKKRTLRNA